MILYTFQGEAPTVCGRVFQRRITRGDTYAEESEVGAELYEYKGVIWLWAPRIMYVFEIWVVNTEVAYYDGRHSQKILSQHERRKKRKYLEACLDWKWHFTPIRFSVDRVVGKDKKTQTKELAADLLTKCYMEYSETCGYVWVRISLNLVYALYFMVWGP